MRPARVAVLVMLAAVRPPGVAAAELSPSPTPSGLSCASPAPPPRLASVYIDRWQAATTEVMAGRHASPLYRDSANRMSAWWRLYAFDRERPWLDEADAERARQLAELGAMAGLERMLRETFERNEALGALYRIGATVSGANLEIHPQPGGPRLRYNVDHQQVRAAEADIEDDPPTHRRRPARKPVTRTGVALQVVDLNDAAEEVDPELALVAYVDMRRMGVDALRLQFADTRPGAQVQDQGNWSVMLRQGLVGELSAFGRVAGQESAGWLPQRATAGLDLDLPTRSEWVIRNQLTRRFAQTVGETETPAEWRVMVTLQARLAWILPQEHGGWTLGDEVDPRQPGS